MKCKICKSFDPDELEMKIVHLWETHGIPIEMITEDLHDFNKKQIEELVHIHRQTGKVSSYKFKI